MENQRISRQLRPARGYRKFLSLNWIPFAIAFFLVMSVISWARAQEVIHKETKKQEKVASSFPEAVAEAQANTPPAGYASLYVLRPSGIVGMAADWCAAIDGQQWGGLASGQFSWDPLAPGDHTLARELKPVTLHAERGETYYVVLSPGTVKLLTQSEGEKMRKKLSLNPTRWLARQYLTNWPLVKIGMKADEVGRLLRMSDGWMYIEKPGGSSEVFRARTVVGDAPVTASINSGLLQFTSSIIGYQLTFANGILTGKAEAAPFGGTLGMSACVPPTWH